MKLAKKIVKNERGQVLILFALLIIVLMGLAALAIDLGMVAIQKANLQNAADAAALAGAQDLPTAGTAENTAIIFAGMNGLKATHNGVKKDGDTVTATATYNGDPTKIEVICTRTVPYIFARFLGFTQADVTARAVAKKIPSWSGEALPFLNLDDDYLADSKIVAWEKTGPGDFESLWKDEYQMFNLGKNDDHSKGYFKIDYADGISITKGTVATIKQEVGYLYEQHKPVYVFSLSSDVIKSGKYNSKLKNKDVIPLTDLVLLQVTFDSYDYSGKTLYFTVTEVYDINNGILPTNHLNADSKGSSSLVD